ncbi:MAG TPA: hypothetical protein VG456_16355 [Candidatus Sulfopaludibacter sp.]|jgi:hypothetical protein|nr:hypothetical protein [Candidatus Sulfopaludibacter sp.]
MGNTAKKPVPQAPAVPNTLGALLIRVKDPEGNPVKGEVKIFIKSIEETHEGVLDDEGTIKFPDLAAGLVDVTVTPAAGFGPVPSGNAPFKPGPRSASVTVEPGPGTTFENVVFTKAAGFLIVKVIDSKLKPLAKVPVEVSPAPLDGIAKFKTNDAGIVDFGMVTPVVPHHIKAGTADITVKPLFGPPNSPPQAVLIGLAETDKSVAIGEVATVPMQLELKKLEIVKLDPHFASSKEKMDIRFAIAGLSGRKVVLTIEGENYAGKKLVERDLGALENADGENNQISWDGKIEVGASKDQFATPLMGPFKVTLFHDDASHTGALKSEKPFKILYHSIVLDFGKHVADETAPPDTDQTKFVQFKLNELHYDAGPVTGAGNLVTTNAIKRFQRANYQAGTQTLLTENGALDAALIASIKAASAREVFESGKTPLTQDAKFYVYDNYLVDRGQNFVTSGLPEFQTANRQAGAEDKMERAFIPLEVEVKLLSKANTGVSAPDAIGPVPVAWEVADSTEDDSVIPGTNATAKTYVKHAREIGATAASAGAARIDTDGDNALDTFDGMRKSAAGDYIKQWFPDAAGSKLEPYTVKKYDTEDRGGKTFQRAIVEAWADITKFPKRKGRAGAYFRFSTKGGDNAKIRVSLAFKDLPNKDQLEKDHKDAKATLFKELGRWTVWRRSKINAYCRQGVATRKSGNPNFSIFRDRYKEAYIELENNGQPAQTLNYATVVTAAKYNAAILGLPPAKAVPGVTAANLVYRADSVYGGVMPPRAQNNAEAAIDYVRAMSNTINNWCANPLHAVLQLLHQEARKTAAEGYVIWDFRLSDALVGQDFNPALNHGAGGFQLAANPKARSFHPSTAGYVHVDGAVTMNVDNPFDINCYLCHECGHARFLIHHKFVNEAPGPNLSANPSHHDGAQDKCTMSYAKPGDTPDQWTYPFCGKCLLRLRGWNVPALPNQYT